MYISPTSYIVMRRYTHIKMRRYTHINLLQKVKRKLDYYLTKYKKNEKEKLAHYTTTKRIFTWPVCLIIIKKSVTN